MLNYVFSTTGLTRLDLDDEIIRNLTRQQSLPPALPSLWNIWPPKAATTADPDLCGATRAAAFSRQACAMLRGPPRVPAETSRRMRRPWGGQPQPAPLACTPSVHKRMQLWDPCRSNWLKFDQV
jgi:hypothetical protein